MKPRANNRGMSLLEIMIVLGVLVVVMVAIYMVIFRSSREYTNTSKIGTVSENGRRVMDEMSKEMRQADKTNCIPGGAPATIYARFRTLKEFTSGNPVFNGYYVRYELGTSPVDANNNGIRTDDYCLNRVEEAPGPSGTATAEKFTRLCDYVKGGGLSFFRETASDTVKITLTLQVADDKNDLLERIVETSVTLRNEP